MLTVPEHKGTSAFLLKPGSKIKRSHKDILEVQDEEIKLEEDKQRYFKEVKRLRRENANLNMLILSKRIED